MFLNQTLQYALRAMACVVNHDSIEPIRSKELSVRTGVPIHYLSKIMRKMVEAGYVESQKGHGGGFILKIPPSRIRIIDVLNAMGFDKDAQPCVFGWKKCSNEVPCPLHPVWKNLKSGFEEWAHQTTYEDIRDDKDKLSISSS